MIERISGGWQNAAQRVLDIQEKMSFLVNAKNEAMKELIELSDGVSSFGNGYTFEQIQREGSVDYKAIPELKGVDLNKYRKESINYWKLSFTKQFDI